MATTIDSAESQLLLAHVLGVDQAHLLAHPSPRLKPWQRWRYRRLLARRAAGWPVAYLLGEKWFYGRRFYVNRHTLIPRPETETLIDVVRGIVGTEHAPIARTIEVGTGSGCIAVTLAAELGADIIATDVSAKALKVAKGNARRHGVARRITFLRGSLLEPITKPRSTIYDQRRTTIVANLPYLPANHPVQQTPFEPRRALYGGGTDGLGLIRNLVDQCRDAKYYVSTIALEIDPRQAEAVQNLLRRGLPHGQTEIYPDLAGQARVAVWSERHVG